MTVGSSRRQKSDVKRIQESVFTNTLLEAHGDTDCLRISGHIRYCMHERSNFSSLGDFLLTGVQMGSTLGLSGFLWFF